MSKNGRYTNTILPESIVCRYDKNNNNNNDNDNRYHDYCARKTIIVFVFGSFSPNRLRFFILNRRFPDVGRNTKFYCFPRVYYDPYILSLLALCVVCSIIFPVITFASV